MNKRTSNGKRKKLWSLARITDPRHPDIMLRVTELKPGGNLYVVRMVDGKQKMASLKCKRSDFGSSREEQERQVRAKALDLIAGLASGSPIPSRHAEPLEAAEALTLGAVADLYELHGLHGRSDKYSKEQPAKVRRIVAMIGRDRLIVSVSKSDVERFAAARRAGGAGQATVWGDVTALKIALNWATEYNREDGSPLLQVNPLARVRVDREKSPRRPVAGEERYLKLRAVSEELDPLFGLALDMAWSTGHRIGAILTLRWEDVSFEASSSAPLGTIRWYAGVNTDNKNAEHVVPMNALARQALELAREDRPGIGAAWVFPAPMDDTKPLGYHVAKRWLEQAEKLAKVPHLKRGSWHPFRRGWATARKAYPMKDVAEAGGWRDLATLQRSYIHSDPETVLSVVNG